MPVHDRLGLRMKEFYESVPKTRLMRRTPVAIRLDGKAFHTFTRGFAKPFDKVLMKTMQRTMKYLCENIENVVLGYTQSDEITLILIDYKKLNSEAWFNYEVEKMCSISASMATLAFNKYFKEEVQNFADKHIQKDKDFAEYLYYDPQLCNYMHVWDNEESIKLFKTYCNAEKRGAMFDSRVFNIPREEVTNLIYWRQLDATRNSIQMAGQAQFSHAELHEKTCNMIQEMLHEQKGINWNDYPVPCKRGSCCIKMAKDLKFGPISLDENNKNVKKLFNEPDFRQNITYRLEWRIDENIPIFKGEGREYIERLLLPEEE